MRRGVESFFTYTLNPELDNESLKVVFEQFGETVLELGSDRMDFDEDLGIVATTVKADETLRFAPGMAHTQLVFLSNDPYQKLYTAVSDVLGFYVKDQFIRSNVSSGGGGIGTRDYEKLKNLPSINGVELQGDRSFSDLGITDLSKTEILEAVAIAANEVFK